MVDIEHFGEVECLERESVGDECPLEVAHAAVAPLNASREGVDGTWSKSIYSARDKAACVALVEKRLYVVVAFIHIYIEWFLVVDIVSDAHQSVDALFHAFLQCADLLFKLLWAEDGVNGGETERSVGQIAADFIKAMHRRWSALYHEAQRHRSAFQSVLLYVEQVVAHLCCKVVADYDYLFCIVVHKDSD